MRVKGGRVKRGRQHLSKGWALSQFRHSGGELPTFRELASGKLGLKERHNHLTGSIRQLLISLPSRDLRRPQTDGTTRVQSQ